MANDWGKTQAEVNMSQFKRLVEDAPVKDVDVPDGRKDVEIAWTNSQGEFTTKDGIAIGVYRDRDGLIQIDWVDEDEATVVKIENINYFEESQYL